MRFVLLLGSTFVVNNAIDNHDKCEFWLDYAIIMLTGNFYQLQPLVQNFQKMAWAVLAQVSADEF